MLQPRLDFVALVLPPRAVPGPGTFCLRNLVSCVEVVEVTV